MISSECNDVCTKYWEQCFRFDWYLWKFENKVFITLPSFITVPPQIVHSLDHTWSSHLPRVWQWKIHSVFTTGLHCLTSFLMAGVIINFRCWKSHIQSQVSALFGENYTKAWFSTASLWMCSLCTLCGLCDAHKEAGLSKVLYILFVGSTADKYMTCNVETSCVNKQLLWSNWTLQGKTLTIAKQVCSQWTEKIG